MEPDWWDNHWVWIKPRECSDFPRSRHHSSHHSGHHPGDHENLGRWRRLGESSPPPAALIKDGRSVDSICIASPSSTKRLRLRYPGVCIVCRRDLAIGEKAIWNRRSMTVTCLGCSSVPPPSVTEGQAGASALREYERRHAMREQYARKAFGGVGVLLSRMIKEPQSTWVWWQGARGEARTGQRLVKLLNGHGVRLLHDRRVLGHGEANIDHIAVGPAGVLVIDTKTHKGKVRTDWVGGLFAPRRTVLLVNGRDRTHLVDGVERQLGYVRDALGDPSVGVRGALCFPNVDGLPLFSKLLVRDIVIDGPKPIAKLARRPGPLSAAAIEQVWQQLGRAFPPA